MELNCLVSEYTVQKRCRFSGYPEGRKLKKYSFNLHWTKLKRIATFREEALLV
jgi:ribosomal protein L37E